MGSHASWLLAALAVLALVFTVPWIRLFLGLRALRLSPADAPDDATLAAIPLRPFEQAAVAELQAWGFERIRDSFDRLGWEPVRVVFFAHRELPHCARLHLRGTAPVGLPVTFVSFGADGRPIATVNRAAWSAALGCDGLGAVDARVDSIEAQWALHRERAAQARPLESTEAADRVEAALAAAYAESLATGRWIQGRDFVQPSLRTAWRTAAVLRADRRLLQRPLDSAATRGDNADGFLAASLELQERLRLRHRTERAIRLGLLAVTVVLAWLAWGALFDWATAGELVAIVFVHEMGHALAMRAFGWTNLHVFFIPMLGAVATGGRPRAPAAWKDVLVLLAGPVPGLAAGLAVLASPLAADPSWHGAALMAVTINAFNLLPLQPLDGGQLLAIALFNRWPRARLAFIIASAGGLLLVGWKLEAPVTYFIALMLLVGWRREWRLAGIERQAASSAGAGGTIADVCAAVGARLPGLALLQRSVLAQLVLARRQVPRAGVALGLSVVVGLGALWGVAAAPLAAAFAPRPQVAHRDHRSPAQRAFDDQWYAAGDGDVAADLPKLVADAGRLDANDPRRRDVDWLRTRSLPPEQRARAVANWLAAGDGHMVSRRSAAMHEVDDQVGAASTVDATRRLAAMRQLAAWTHGMPGLPVEDVIARLRLAEAMDLAGDEAGARRSLDEIVGAAAARVDCRCGLRQAIAARAWFEMTHDRPLEAIRVLDGPVARTLGGTATDDLARVRAWAFLQAGDVAGGLAEMKTALHADDLDADFRPRRPAGQQEDEADEFELWNAPELAVALHAAGQRDAARRLCRTTAREACEDDAARTVGATVGEGAWQARHVRERATLARELLMDERGRGAPVAHAPASGARM